MRSAHPKSIRGRILKALYECYLADPLDMMDPQDVLDMAAIEREDLLANTHYLADRGLVELMRGYNPPLFAAARITADGIDLVENEFEFNLRFPPEPDRLENGHAGIAVLMERLKEEAEFAPLDGEERRTLLRDVEFLRDEVARPAHRWRRHVIETVLEWIQGHVDDAAEDLPSAALLADALARRPR